MRKDEIERRRVIAEENKIMMMNRADMDEITVEWHDIARREILQWRKQALVNGNGDGGASGGGGGGAGGGACGGGGAGGDSGHGDDV